MVDCTEEQIFEGDIGTSIRFIVKSCNNDVDPPVLEGVDISGMVTNVIYLKTPDGTLLERTGVLLTDGTDFTLHYETIAGDLTPYGDWEGQAIVELPGGKWNTTIIEFEVLENLKPFA